jgi:hypothetical protein
MVAALLLNAMTCRVHDQHPMLSASTHAQVIQIADSGGPMPPSPTAPLAGELLTHHSCVVALLALSLLAVPFARSAAIAIPPVMRRSQLTTAPLLPPP